MVFYAWNDFEVRRQNINWLTSLAEITILLQLANVSPCCFYCIGTMKNAVKQSLIIWSRRQFNFHHNYAVERSSQGWQLFILKRKKILHSRPQSLLGAWARKPGRSCRKSEMTESPKIYGFKSCVPRASCFSCSGPQEALLDLKKRNDAI